MQTVNIRNIELAYNDTSGAGAPVILLHQYPLNSAAWQAQVDALQADYRVITPDLRGFGASSVGGNDDTANMHDMADDVAALMDELQIERAVISGLSMGGYAALSFMQRHAARARALVLADTSPDADTEEAKAKRAATIEKILTSGMSAIAEDFLKSSVGRTALQTMPDTVTHLRALILATNPRGAAAALRGMATRADQNNSLSAIHVPTLVMVGEEDQLTPPTLAEKIRDGISGAQYAVIKGAGHHSNIENPQEFSRALKDFLDKLPQ